MTAGLAGLPLGGCIQVKAPDKPIEINLNVKVQQEVVANLQRDAQDLIQNNPDLFPQRQARWQNPAGWPPPCWRWRAAWA